MTDRHPIASSPPAQPRFGVLGLIAESLAVIQLGSETALMGWPDLVDYAARFGDAATMAAFLLDEFARCRYRRRHGLSWTPLLLTLAEVLERTRRMGGGPCCSPRC